MRSNIHQRFIMSTLSSISTGSDIRLDNLASISGDILATNVFATNVTGSGRVKGVTPFLHQIATAAQNISNAETVVLFPTVTTDQGTHNITYSAGTFTSTIAQTILVTFTIPWPSYVTVANRWSYVKVNSNVQKHGLCAIMADAGNNIAVCGSVVLSLSANDTFVIRATQNAIGGSLPTQYIPAQGNWCAITVTCLS